MLRHLVQTKRLASFSTIKGQQCTRDLSKISKYASRQRVPLAKIVATIGPASEQMPTLGEVVDAGMRIMRINFSHATYDEANLRVKNLADCEGFNFKTTSKFPAEKNFKNARAILLDTQGPEIRLGSFGNDVKEVTLYAGDEVILTNDDTFKANQSPEKLWISYKKLLKTVKEGVIVLLDDGIIQLKVKSIQEETDSITCEVLNTGVLGNKKGVNLPGLAVELPAMSEKDKQDIRWGVENDVDYIAASFVRKANDVREIKDYVSKLMKEFHADKPGYPHPAIISKIESTEALDNFDSIVDISDGIMVARGDLAVEIPMAILAGVQKHIVAKCNEEGKPVIVATQMLESMQKNPRPTRAECTDVANAILDGADCVMLSGESAKGKYPVQAVGMMNKIVLQTEENVHNPHPWMTPIRASDLQTISTPGRAHPINAIESMAIAAVEATQRMQVCKDSIACIVIIGEHEDDASDTLAKFVSKHKPMVPIVCVVPTHKQGKILQMYRGLHPLVIDSKNMDLSDGSRGESLLEKITQHLRLTGFLHSPGYSKPGKMNEVGSGEKILILRAGTSIDMTLATV